MDTDGAIEMTTERTAQERRFIGNALPRHDRLPPLWITSSHCRRLLRLMNLTFRRSFVRMVLLVNGIFLSIPGLCRTENFPKLPSFNVNPFVPRLPSLPSPVG